MNVGANLRSLRLAKSLTQDALAEAIGVSTKTYRKMEAGKTKIAVGSLPKAAQALDTSVDELMKPEGMTLHNNFRNQNGHNVVFGYEMTGTEREQLEEKIRERDALPKEKDGLIHAQQAQIQALLEKIQQFLVPASGY